MNRGALVSELTYTLTDVQEQLLRLSDSKGYICKSAEERCPGIHFCPEWDFMAICIGTPEWQACTCAPPIAGGAALIVRSPQ